MLTREAGAALTPQYAAPEQLAQGQVTTATDVYALGVLLYVLLSGQHPAGAATRSPATLIRAIAEVEPRLMSDAVVGEPAIPEEFGRHAAQCGTTATRLSRALQGDLDTIVAKALKKNASERYVSVTAFADDLQRFLRHEPISARPDTLRYRATRFIKRHARGVAAAAVVVLTLVGMTAFYTTRLATERDRAQREAAKAARVSEALSGLLRGADPIANPATPDGLTVTGLLDSATDRVEKELADQPDAQAEIFTIIGRMYRRVGMYDKAQHLLERALLSGQAAFGPEHPSVAQTLNDLGALAAEKGDYRTAAASLESALSTRRRIYGRNTARPRICYSRRSANSTRHLYRPGARFTTTRPASSPSTWRPASPPRRLVTERCSGRPNPAIHRIGVDGRVWSTTVWCRGWCSRGRSGWPRRASIRPRYTAAAAR